MKPKDYLLQYRGSIERAKEIEQHLHELKAEAIALKDHEGNSVALDEAVAKYVDACNAQAKELEHLQSVRFQVRGTIGQIHEENLRSLLYHRYILGKTWEEVAVCMHYTYVHVIHNLHPKALKAVKDLIEFNT